MATCSFLLTAVLLVVLVGPDVSLGFRVFGPSVYRPTHRSSGNRKVVLAGLRGKSGRHNGHDGKQDIKKPLSGSDANVCLQKLPEMPRSERYTNKQRYVEVLIRRFKSMLLNPKYVCCPGCKRVSGKSGCTCSAVTEPLFITLLVYSGRPDPQWEIKPDDPSYGKIRELLISANKNNLTKLPGDVPSRLGYKGFFVQEKNQRSAARRLIYIYGPETKNLQKCLFETAPNGTVSTHLINIFFKDLSKKKEVNVVSARLRGKSGRHNGHDGKQDIEKPLSGSDANVRLQKQPEMPRGERYSNKQRSSRFKYMLQNPKYVCCPGCKRVPGKPGCTCSAVTEPLFITLLVYSGRPNPQWEIKPDDPSYGKIRELLISANKNNLTKLPGEVPSRLGYKGFFMQEKNQTSAARRLIYIYGPETKNLQKRLLETAPNGTVSKHLINIVLKDLRKKKEVNVVSARLRGKSGRHNGHDGKQDIEKPLSGSDANVCLQKLPEMPRGERYSNKQRSSRFKYMLQNPKYVCCPGCKRVPGKPGCTCSAVTEPFFITLLVFSGRRDPQWVIKPDDPSYRKIRELFFSAKKNNLTKLPGDVPSRLGYKGFFVQEKNQRSAARNLIYGPKTTELQKRLLETVPKGTISTYLINICLKEIDKKKQ